MTSRKLLIYLATIYKGDWDKIYEALQAKEKISEKRIEKVYSNLKSKAVTIVDSDYPEPLKCCTKPPFVIFYHGNLALLKNKHKMISVIGSRDNSVYGEKTANYLIKDLCKELIIVSGMARGIDGIAHRAAINNGGKTIAVLGCGINVCYPAKNLDIYDECRKNHLVISEYPDLTPPTQLSFPIRNRLVAGISDCLLVIEGERKSGTSITAMLTLEGGGNVCCVPTSIFRDSICNDLIACGARLTQTVNDIYDEMGYVPKRPIFEK